MKRVRTFEFSSNTDTDLNTLKVTSTSSDGFAVLISFTINSKLFLAFLRKSLFDVVTLLKGFLFDDKFGRYSN